MWKYILKRILMLIPILLGVLIIVFVLNEITPGDPARQIAGEHATEEEVEAVREELGLNRPMVVRFGDYVFKLATRGDLGKSYMTKQHISQEIMERFPRTLLLAALTTVVTVVIGIPLGIVSATKQYSFFDYLCSILGLAGVSIPIFWQGLMGILIFAVYLHWFPPSGFYGPSYWILPVFTLATSNAAQVMRMTRSSMLEVINAEYIQSARAKGLSESAVIYKHALKNALLPVLTVIGMDFGISLGGTVITETVFGIAGVGKYMVDAISSRDYPVVQGGVVVLAFMVSIVTLLVDILYAFVDPRIKAMYKNADSSLLKKKKLRTHGDLAKGAIKDA